MDDRQWATFVAGAGIQADKDVKEFTPDGWGGFSADPSGDISYLDFGAIVMLWVASGSLLGTSDAATMTVGTLPEAIRPTALRFVRCLVMNNGFIIGGAASIAASGSITFYAEDVSAGGVGQVDRVWLNQAGFEASGQKGLPEGFILVFSKR
jgi:hypothetical protein